ncbi:hypothetical protein [Deinococcus sedimenti]|uniref:Uncharacterized protein n=1 Tax=Deinococcus sedimenti TaxID=1867090 RepID=A0ABQ2RZH1_9DEIO|nr:hypothetical protein [Deinococcus sedimenti]GGR83520.1 hypothetical protein GCM10008960_08220 [Deinococcus sedimenti]
MSAPPPPTAPRSVSWARVARLFLSVLLLLTAGALALLALGLFASLASNGPLWLQSVGVVAATLTGAAGLGSLSGLHQALLMMVLTSVVAGGAAYLKPRP